ncbi:hypothetical protein BGZ83_006011 [Gryganskiella cystojenkinii]|nr:hypothetical protein BGZ83_006011 [Gryganskiella cystojenkinii]
MSIRQADTTLVSLKRETTEDMSKLYTTLFEDDTQQQQQYFQQRDLSSPEVTSPWETMPDSPGSPYFSTCSTPSSPDTSFTVSGIGSPLSTEMMMMDFCYQNMSFEGTANEQQQQQPVNLFDIANIDDLLAAAENANSDMFASLSSFQPQHLPQSWMMPQAFSLFLNNNDNSDNNAQTADLLDQSQQQQLTGQVNQNRSVGPCRATSLSPKMHPAPYHVNPRRELSPMIVKQESEESSFSSSSSSSSSSAPSSPHHHTCCCSSKAHKAASPKTKPSKAATKTTATLNKMPKVKKEVKPSAKSSIKATESSATSTSTSTSTTTTTPEPENATVLNDEMNESAMVFDPETETVTFICHLCPKETFGRIHDLKRHQASKHQAISWACEYCARPFVRRDALLRHYSVKAVRDDGIHPSVEQPELLMDARARAKLMVAVMN